MTKGDIFNAVVNGISKVQALSGRALPLLTESTCPIGDLEGFDSMNAVEACTFIAAQIGYALKPHIMLSSSPDKPLQICQIVERISQSIIGSSRGGTHG